MPAAAQVEERASGPVVAVVPLRSIVSGKSRLADALSDGLRHDLIAAMFADVVACLRAAMVPRIIAAAGDATAVAAAISLGVEYRGDPTGGGINAAVQQVIDGLAPSGRLLVVMPDLPLLSPEEVGLLLSDPNPIAVAETRDGGTGVLSWACGVQLAPRFGPRSAQAHLESARLAGLECTRYDLPGAAFDIDTVADVSALVAGPSLQAAALGLRTRQLRLRLAEQLRAEPTSFRLSERHSQEAHS